jgi:hypothetical protein
MNVEEYMAHLVKLSKEVRNLQKIIVHIIDTIFLTTLVVKTIQVILIVLKYFIS